MRDRPVSLNDLEESMLEATTVVTPARFEQGLPYVDFLAEAKVNRDKFEKFYNDPALTQNSAARTSTSSANTMTERIPCSANDTRFMREVPK